MLKCARLPLLAACMAGVLLVGCGSTPSTTAVLKRPAGQTHAASTSAPPPATPTPPTDKAAPSSKGPPAFSIHGHTEHGDKVHVEGRFGPILAPSESDVDRTALQSCLDAGGGRELVRRLDITATITSGLSGEVRIGGFVVRATEESQHSHFILDYVMDGGGGLACYRDTGEEGSTGVINLGRQQPQEPRHFTMWVVLPDAITPSDPHPSAKKLASEEWYIGYPVVSVDGAVAAGGGGELSVTG
jgi:hypothetical protein